jgi:uncharacterized protein
MIAKKHVTHDKRLILAVCDKDILGKCFTEKDRILDLRSDFYKGEELSETKLSQLMRSAYIINLAGKKSLAFAKKLNLVDNETIIIIDKVPHAQVLVVSE